MNSQTACQEQDEHWMQHALALADRAAAEGEVPIGAVIVRDGVLLAEGWNRPIASHDPTSHAEINALRAAAAAEGNYRLTGATLYVTIEPCLMCVGALIHARIQRLVFGATEPRTGAVHSVLPLLQDEAAGGLGKSRLNHYLEVTGGVLADTCAARMRDFFRQRRLKASAASA